MPDASPIEVWVLPASGAHSALTALLGTADLPRSSEGKPQLPGGPHFNLSHSGELALIALCPDAAVGVDVEAPRRIANLAGLARRMCSARELEFLTASASADAEAALLRLWVRKEAVAKAEGGGIATALSGIDVLGPLVAAGGELWFVHDLAAPAPGYVAALAWSASPADTPSSA